MEISVSRNHLGENLLEIGPVTLTLSDEVVRSLQHVVHKRLSQTSDEENATVIKKLNAYKALATKMIAVDDRILQRLALKLSPEQLVTMVRLAQGQDLYHKIMKNLSKTNRAQFEDDCRELNKITFHQAIIYMEQIVPHIKQAAQEQKEMLTTRTRNGFS